MVKKHLQTYLQIQNNLYIKFFIAGKIGYYDFIGYKKDGTKISAVFPMSRYDINEAVEQINQTLNGTI